MQPIYDEVTAVTVSRLNRDIFRDYLIQMLGPSPFFPEWTVSQRSAESIADKMMEYFDANPEALEEAIDHMVKDV